MASQQPDASPEDELSAYRAMLDRDAAIRAKIGVNWDRSWQHLNRRLAQGALTEMEFDVFAGPEHLSRMYNWIDQIQYHNFLDDAAFHALVADAREADFGVLDTLGLDRGTHGVGAVSLYNAQDFRFQVSHDGPDRRKPRHVVDFGAGHGRQANLWFQHAPHLTRFTSIDSIVAPYMTQRMYYRALGLTVNDPMDCDSIEDFTLSDAPKTVNHLPSWRMQRIPDGSVDMVLAVQVLRELSRPMLLFALRQFRRMLKPGGALYIRDHIGFHNVNMQDLDRILAALGFVVEWQPAWVDGRDIHGVPRIWRKADLQAITGVR